MAKLSFRMRASSGPAGEAWGHEVKGLGLGFGGGARPQLRHAGRRLEASESDGSLGLHVSIASCET